MVKIAGNLNKPVVAALLIATSLPFAAAAQTNDFFGGSLPGGGPLPAGGYPQSPQAQAADVARSNLPADYTDDEKRMQRKYRASISHAKGLIAKGDRMMKAGEGGKNDKDFKKGKVLKEIGERRLAELEANNPLPEAAKKKSELTEQPRTEER